MSTRGKVVVILAAAALLAQGQGTTSRLVGAVSDATGAAVGGAKVTLVNDQTGTVFATESGAAGNYQFEAIQIGFYTVSVEMAGFKKFQSKGNQVSVGVPTTVNVVLEVGNVVESVEVEATAEQVQLSQSGNVGPVISERLMKEMPIVATRRRDPTSILTYLPGMNSGGNTGGGGHMNGARDRSWNFTLDGIDMNEVSAGGGVGNNPIRVNPDSVAEMKIVTSNASAEFGRNSGGQVAMVTKSGTNELHGNAFWFYRTPRLNANQWEDNLNRVGKQMFVQNIYGGSVGGPIRKNKMFYFANWQELRASRSVSQTATVLTQEARNGIYRFSTVGQNAAAGATGASVDASGNPIVPIQSYNIVQNDPERRGLDPTVRALIAATPLPNRFDAGGDGLNYAGHVFRPTETERQRDLTGKVDYVVNARNTVYGRIYWGFQDTLCDGVNGGLPRVPGAPCLVDTKRSPRNYAFNWRANPKAAITNEFVAGYSEFFFDFPNPTQDLKTPTLSAPLNITIPASTTFGNARKLKTFQFVDNLSYFGGKHAIKGGTNLRFVQHLDTRGSIGGQNSGLVVNFDRTINTVNPNAFGLPAAINQATDRVNLESMINLLLGRVGTAAQGFVAEGNAFRTGTFDFDSRFYEYDFYAQDTWKLSKRLTIDLGMRLEARRAPASAGRQPILTPGFTVAAGTAPSNTLRWSPGKLYRSDWNNWSPSVGFAWDPFGDGKTSVRSNYRLAYDRIPTFLLSSFLFPSMPGSVLGEVNSAYGAAGGRLAGLPSLTPTRTPQDLAQPVPFSLATNTVVDPNLETPQTHMWSISIQRQVAERTVVEVDYIGRRAHNLLGGYNANQAEIRTNGFLDAFLAAKAGGESALLDRLTSADSRRLATESGAAFLRRQFGPDLGPNNNVAGLANGLAQRTQSGTNLSNASGLGPFFFYRYPQFSGGLNVIDSNDISTFHSLQLSVNQRFRTGANLQVFYTWSKSLDTRSYDPAFTLAGSGVTQTAANTPFDINNRRLNYALSDFDRTHQLQFIGTQDLPFGRGQRFAANSNALVDRLIGGWNLSGLFRWTSGRPFTVFGGSNSFNSFVGSFANCSGCSRSDGAVRDEGGLVWYFDPAERAKFTRPGPGELGNVGRNFFRGDRVLNLDLSIIKRTRLSERMNLELRADFTNFTNTPSFGFPTTTLTLGNFGRIRDTVSSSSRQTMLAAKINF